jgi:signal transduction histidine kinase
MLLFLRVFLFSLLSVFLFNASAWGQQQSIFTILNAEQRTPYSFLAKTEVSNEFTKRIEQDINKAVQHIWTNPNTARVMLDSIFFKAVNINYYTGAAKCKINLGLVYLAMGQFDEALQQLRMSSYYINYAPTKHTLQSALNINFGAAYYYKMDYDKAFEYYYTVLKLMLGNGKRSNYNLIMTYNNIADVLLKMQAYEKAQFYLDEGERLMTSLKIEKIYGYIWANKADLAMLTKDYPTYRKYIELARTFGVQHNHNDIIQSVYAIEAQYEMDHQNYKAAIAKLNKAINVNNHNAYAYYTDIMPHYSLGKAYFFNNQYDSAEYVLTQTIHRAQDVGVDIEKLDALKILTKIYAHKLQYDKAYISQNKYLTLQESINEKEKYKLANELEIRFRTAEKDKELVQQQLLIQKQEQAIKAKNQLIFLIIFGLSLLITVAILLMWYSKTKSKINLIQAQINGEEKERTRIARELHDGIGGMLAVLKMRVTTQPQPSKEIIALLNKTSDEVRKTAHNLMPDGLVNITLKEALTNYISSTKSNTHALDINVDMDHDLEFSNPNTKLSIYRIVQEIIQNMYKHAQATDAYLQFIVNKDVLMIDKKNVKKGLGLINLESRVKALRGSMHISAAPHRGTTINIEIPI